MFKLLDNWTYDDGDEQEGTDTFAREPYCVKVKINGIQHGAISKDF